MSIQVAGLDWFPENRWREALLQFLFGMWSGPSSQIWHRPKIRFGDISLRLDDERKRYIAYFSDGQEQDTGSPDMRGGNILSVVSDQNEVEVGLARFIKDDSITILTIAFPNHGQLMLWKKEKRGQFGISGQRLSPHPFHQIAMEERLKAIART